MSTGPHFRALHIGDSSGTLKKHGERQLRITIAQILLQDWDPIGIAEEPLAQDEYNSYIGGVYRLLVSGPSKRDIAGHLHNIEWVSMELSSAAGYTGDRAARKLRSLVTEAATGAPGSTQT